MSPLGSWAVVIAVMIVTIALTIALVDWWGDR